MTTSDTSFFVPWQDLNCVHVQKNKYKSPNVSAKVLIELLKKGESVYDLSDDPDTEKVLNGIVALRSMVEKEEFSELEKVINIPNLDAESCKEMHYNVMGDGDRETGFLTKKSALYLTLVRWLTCRNLEKKYDIPEFHKKLWKSFNKNQISIGGKTL